MNDELIELKAQREAAEARLAELDQAIAEAKVLAAQSVAEQVLATIAEAGFQPEDILPMLEHGRAEKAPRKARKARGEYRPSGKVWPVYQLIGDPSLTYSRGRMPGWMKEDMGVAGLDTTSKEDRIKFRETRMVLVA